MLIKAWQHICWYYQYLMIEDEEARRRACLSTYELAVWTGRWDRWTAKVQSRCGFKGAGERNVASSGISVDTEELTQV